MSGDVLAKAWCKAIGTDQKQFNMFFKNMMDGFSYNKIIVDPAGKPIDYIFLEVNDAFEQMTGLKKKKIIRKKATEVFKGLENDVAKWIGVYGKVALTCESIQFDDFTKPLGKWFHISAYCPEKGYFVTLLEDITERKTSEGALEESREKYRRLFTNMIDGLAYCQMIFDSKGKPSDFVYLEINDAFEKITGLKKENVVGKKVSEAIPGTLKANPEIFDIYGRVALTGIEDRFEVFFKPLQMWLSISVYSPQKGYFVAVFENITGRKKAEEALRVSEHRWSTTLSSIGDAVIATDTKSKITFMNGVAEKLTGWALVEANGRHIERIFNIVNEKTRHKVENPVVKVLEKGLIIGLANHTVLIRKDKSEVPIDDSGAPIKDKDGNVSGVVLVFRDISEKKKSEEKIAQQAFMIANANDAIIGYDLDQKVTFWNKSAERLYGYSAEEAFGRASVELLKPTYPTVKREELLNRLAREGHSEIESIRLTKDRRSLDIEAHVILLRNENGESIGYVSVDRDITEGKKAEQQLREAKNDWERTFDTIPDFIAILDNKHKIVRANRAMAKQLGVNPQQAIGLSCYECVHGTAVPPEFCPHAKTLEDGKEHVAEVHEPRLGGDFIVSTTPIKDDKERVTGSVHVARNITERKNAEREIERLASFPTLNPNPVFEVDFDGRIIYANPATRILFPDLELLGKAHPFFCDWQNIVKNFENNKIISLKREVKVAEHWYREEMYFVSQTGKIRVYSIDVDELKKTEEARFKAQVKLEENAVLLEEYASQMEELAEQRAQQLKNSERLAAIGQTAGMVGHDIRNPLQAITGDMYLIKEELKTMPEGESKQAILESVDSVNENLTYIDKIVSDLQDYTRPLRPSIQEANLAELTEGIILTINVPKRIELTTEIKDNSKAVETDVAYLRRILTNLITNAVQAMPKEGKLTIKANKKKEKIIISVEDTGVGIPEEVKTKMFTPLFTTKSKGQGLGLAVVKRLVDALSGQITFDSQPDKGTKFIVELPQKLKTK